MAKFTMDSMLNAVTKYQCEELWLVPRTYDAKAAGSMRWLMASQHSSFDLSTMRSSINTIYPMSNSLTLARHHWHRKLSESWQKSTPT
jgi:hypothetical protein